MLWSWSMINFGATPSSFASSWTRVFPAISATPFDRSQEPTAPGSGAPAVEPRPRASQPPGLGTPGASGPAARTPSDTPPAGPGRPPGPDPAAQGPAPLAHPRSGRVGAARPGAGLAGNRGTSGSANVGSPFPAVQRPRVCRSPLVAGRHGGAGRIALCHLGVEPGLRPRQDRLRQRRVVAERQPQAIKSGSPDPRGRVEAVLHKT